MVSDLKQEIVPVVENIWKKSDVGVDLWAPLGCQSKHYTHTNFNFLEAPIDCRWNDDCCTKDTGAYFRLQADLVTPAPAPDAMNVFFSGNGRRTLMAVGSQLIINSPEIATFSEIFKIASDPPRAKEILRKGAERTYSNTDGFENDSIRACKAVLSACEGKNEHHFADFLSYISNPLMPFEEGGHLGQSGEYAVERIADIRKGSNPKVLVCSIPLSHLEEMRLPISLFSNTVFSAIKMYPHGRPVHFCFDEFTALSLPNYHKDVITLRGLECTSEVYVQTENALLDNMSKEAVGTIVDQSDITTIAGITDYEIARDLSARIGSKSKKIFNTNVGDRFNEINFGSNDVDVPVITPQALMSLRKDDQIILVRGMRPIKAKLLPYWDLKGFREFTSDNPLEGSMPKTEAKAEIKINKDGVKVIWPKVPHRFSEKKDKQKSLFRAINLASFLWLLIALPLYLNSFSWLNIPLPALRTQYSYSGSCQYVALDGRSIRRSGTQCPLIFWNNGRML